MLDHMPSCATWRDERRALVEAFEVERALDRAEHAELRRQLVHQATHDALTGLGNRALLRERLTRAIADAERTGGRIALLGLDLDRFQRINDGFGHSYGDRVLQAVADRIRALREGLDLAARTGGDEFFLVSALRPEDRVDDLAQRIVDAFLEPFDVGGRRIRLTASVGVGVYPDAGTTAAELIAGADMAMYQVKGAARGDYRIFAPGMGRAAQRRTELETALHDAIANGELRLAFQPKVESGSGAIIGCEALLRWDHPELGPVPPAEFIPVAEESGLIVPIGEWVLEQACRQGQAWRDAGLPRITVAVNIAAAQLLQRDAVLNVVQTLGRTNFPADRLELELTESQLAQDVDAAVDVIRRLRTLGVQVAIDDFGTGYSSLDYLRRFDVTALKIDRSFVAGLGTSAGDTAIVRATVALARAYGLSVVAEGVETVEQQAILADIGCDQLQGFLIGRPVPATEFAQQLHRWWQRLHR